MTHPRLPLLLVVLLAAGALSGCIGGSEPEAKPEPTEGTVGPPASSATIQGSVVDAETLTPLAGVSVIIADTRAEVTTDDEGGYAFEQVPKGRYRIVALAAEHDAKSAVVEVAKDQTHWLNFSLEPLAVVSPHEESFPLEGFYECAWGTAVWIDSCTFVARTAFDVAEQQTGQEIVEENDGNNQRDFFWETGDGVEAIVQELVWEKAATSTTQRMRLYLGTGPIDPIEDSSPTYVVTNGVSPIRQIMANLTKEEVEVYKEAGFGGVKVREPVNETMLTRVYLPFDVVPAVAMQQRFTVHVSIFYGYVPGPDYTAIPS